MKKMNLIASAMAITAIVGALTYNATHASVTAEQEAKAVATQYVEALNKGDLENAVKYVSDARFKDEVETLKEYKDIAVNNPTTDFKVISVEATNDKHATITLECFTTETGTVQVSYPMEKKKDNWKIMIDQIKSAKAKGK